MRTARLLVLGTALLAILAGCGDETVGPVEPEPTPDPDVTAPSVLLVSPAPEAELQGNVELRAGAGDNVAVTGVQFLVDDQPYGAEVRFPPYLMSFDSRDVADGPHALSARARDAAGLTTITQPISVTVYNDPGVVELTIEAPEGFEDADGFHLQVDGARKNDISGTGTFTFTGVPAGTRRLSLGGLPPFCGADDQVVKVRSDAPASAVLAIGCMADAADGWLLISQLSWGQPQLSALSLTTGKVTVLVAAHDGLGAVSPDGSRLAYTDGGTLMIGDLAAFAPTVVASVPGASEVSWSPDGSALVVASGQGGGRDLVIVNADGTNLHPVFGTPARRMRPVWSATGRIAYEVTSGGGFGDVTSIGSADPDGSNLVQLTPARDEFSPAWSPDGRQLAFTRLVYEPAGPEVQLGVVNADGTGLRRVTGAEAINNPVWSLDAEWIVHSSRGGLQATHISGAPTIPVIDVPTRALAWVAGSRFD